MQDLRNQDFCKEILACNRCPARQHVAYPTLGEGHSEARIVFIGRDPGRTEYELGRPFVGAAGNVLNSLIAALGLHRANVGIINAKKCHPPGNKAPELEELQACSSWLKKELKFFSKCQVIIPLGSEARKVVLGWHHDSTLKTQLSYYKIASGDHKDKWVVPLPHPAFLLRSPEWNKWAFEIAVPELRTFMGIK